MTLQAFHHQVSLITRQLSLSFFFLMHSTNSEYIITFMQTTLYTSEGGTRCQVPFVISIMYSLSIVFFHCGVAIASWTFVGSMKTQFVRDWDIHTFGLKILALLHIIIGRDGGGGGGGMENSVKEDVCSSPLDRSTFGLIGRVRSELGLEESSLGLFTGCVMLSLGWLNGLSKFRLDALSCWWMEFGLMSSREEVLWAWFCWTMAWDGSGRLLTMGFGNWTRLLCWVY